MSVFLEVHGEREWNELSRSPFGSLESMRWTISAVTILHVYNCCRTPLLLLVFDPSDLCCQLCQAKRQNDVEVVSIIDARALRAWSGSDDLCRRERWSVSLDETWDWEHIAIHIPPLRLVKRATVALNRRNHLWEFSWVGSCLEVGFSEFSGFRYLDILMQERAKHAIEPPGPIDSIETDSGSAQDMFSISRVVLGTAWHAVRKFWYTRGDEMIQVERDRTICDCLVSEIQIMQVRTIV